MITLKTICSILCVAILATGVYSQSSSLDFPTPVTSNDLSGSIKARDVGDARITTYYYWFEGSQGDVFVNLVSKNFAGDIDIFLQAGLKPLTKIVVYPDFGEVETGRVIYLRKPEKLLLRVQGRTPNDDPATFRLRFAGSFVAAAGGSSVPEDPKVSSAAGGSVAVNSVGTKIPQPPKAKEVVDDVKPIERPKADETRAEVSESEKTTDENRTPEKETPKLEVVVSDNTEKAVEKPPVKAPTPRRSRNAARNTTKPAVTPPKVEPEAKTDDTAKAVEEPKKKEPEKKVDPLANVQLVIVFKDGRKIERSLLDVFRFSVDRGVLTVVSKDGRMNKYQMVDVTRVTIE